MIAGAVPMLLIKPYILFPFVLAGGSWYYWARSLKRGRVRIRPASFGSGRRVGRWRHRRARAVLPRVRHRELHSTNLRPSASSADTAAAPLR